MAKRALSVTLPVLLWAAPLWSQVPVGPEFQVNTYTASYQGYPSVAFENGGGFVVVWEGLGQDPSGSGVSGQRYDASGVPLGFEFQVNSYTTGDQGLAKVASLPAGGFVVVWTSTSGDGSDRGIFGRQFDANGVGTQEFRVNSYTTERQQRPAVSADADGNFIVVWQSRGQDGAGYGIYAQRYNASGLAQGTEFRVNASTTGPQENASVSADPDGDFVVAWNSNDGVTEYQVLAQRFNNAGTPLGGELQVTTPMGTTDNGYPSVASDAAGNFVVTWTSFYYGGSSTGIFARRYDAAGDPRGSAFRVNTYTTYAQKTQAVTSDPSGNFVVVWESEYQDAGTSGVFAQRFDTLGAPAGDEFRVNTYTPDNQGLASVVADGAGNFVVAWTSYDQDGSSYGVFAQRFLPDLIFRDGF